MVLEWGRRGLHGLLISYQLLMMTLIFAYMTCLPDSSDFSELADLVSDPEV